MSARYCSFCNIRYPDGMAHQSCDVCKRGCALIPTSLPDDNWRDRVETLKTSKAAKRQAVNPDVTDPTEVEKVVMWRQEELIRCGWDVEAATIVALRAEGDGAVDLHTACQLVASGCPPDVALAILT